MTSLSRKFETFQRNTNTSQAERRETTVRETAHKEEQHDRETEEVKAFVLEYIEFLRQKGIASLDRFVSAGDPVDHYEYVGQVWPIFTRPLEEVKYDTDGRPTSHKEQLFLSDAGTILHGQGRSSMHYPRHHDDGTVSPAEPGIPAAFDIDEYPSDEAFAMLTARLPTTKEEKYTKENIGEAFYTPLFQYINWYTSNPDRPIDRVRAAAQYELDQLDQAQQTELAAQQQADDKQRQAADKERRRQARLDNLVQGLDLPVVAARLEVEIANGASFAATDTALTLHPRRDACVGYCKEETAVRGKLAEIERTHPTIELRLAETDEEGRFNIIAERHTPAPSPAAPLPHERPIQPAARQEAHSLHSLVDFVTPYIRTAIDKSHKTKNGKGTVHIMRVGAADTFQRIGATGNPGADIVTAVESLRHEYAARGYTIQAEKTRLGRVKITVFRI